MDLPKSKLGVDIENDFDAEYHVIHGKTKVLARDQEGGEGQGEHLPRARPGSRGRGDRLAHRAEARHPKRKNVRRVLFNEITKKAVQEAIANPRDLDQHLFEAQQARRVLDRLVGYKLSPLLWKKVRRGLSAGRVQSVAVRIIVEREREIRAFVPEEYWTVEARLEGGAAAAVHARGSPRSTGRRSTTRSSALEHAGAGRRGPRAGSTGADVDRHQGREEGAPPPSDAALHHVAAPAGGVAEARLPAVAHDAHRAAALRGHRARRRGRGRPHHLHAHRLDAHLGRGHRGGARLHRRRATARSTCPRAERLPLEEGRAGRARGDPADGDGVGARSASRASSSGTSSRSTRSSGTASSRARWRPRSTTRPPSTSRRPRCRFRATGQVLKFDGFIRVYTEGQDDRGAADDEDARGPAAAARRGRGADAARAAARAALHAAAAALHAGHADQGARGEGHRPAVDVRQHHGDHPQQGVRRSRTSSSGSSRPSSACWSPTCWSSRSPTCSTSSSPPAWRTSSTAIEEGKEHWVAAMRRFWTPFAKDLERAEVEMRDVKREERPTDLVVREVRQAAWSSSGAGAASSSRAAATRSARTRRTSRATTTARSARSSPRPTDRGVRRSAGGRCRCASAASASSSAARATRSARTSSRSTSRCRRASRASSAARARSTSAARAAATSSTAATAIPSARSRPGTSRCMEPCPRCAAPFVTEKIDQALRHRPPLPAREAAAGRRSSTTDTEPGCEMARAGRRDAAARVRRRGGAGRRRAAAARAGRTEALPRVGSRAGRSRRRRRSSRRRAAGGGAADARGEASPLRRARAAASASRSSAAVSRAARRRGSSRARGVPVDLYEMRPLRGTEAHTDRPARRARVLELVPQRDARDRGRPAEGGDARGSARS